MKNHDLKPDLEMTRVFDAPKKLVFNAFSNEEALGAWWGPAESKNSVISLDFTPGGIFHFKMDFNGKISYGRFLFRKIQPYDLLEFTNAFADENANIIKAPFDIDLPLEILYRFTFTETEGKTTLNVTAQALNPTNEELINLRSINPSMQQGFGGTFDKLDLYLKKNRNEYNG